MIAARIAGTGSALRGSVRTTRELAMRAVPHRDPAQVEERIGIATRRFVEPGTTTAALGAEALREALAAAKMDARDLARVIFVSSTGGDSLVPATANKLLEHMDLSDTCDAFDLNNACTGFLSGLDLAARSVATGLGPTAVVASEIFSRFLPPESPRPYLIMGDAAGAVILDEARSGEGFVASVLKNNADLRDQVTMPHPGITGKPPSIAFGASYDAMTDRAAAALVSSAKRAAERAGIALRDIEWVLPHQPNGQMLERILGALEVPVEKTMIVVREIGSVGAASIAVSLDRLMRSHNVRPGHRVLMAAVGAGTAYGAMIYRSSPEAE